MRVWDFQLSDAARRFLLFFFFFSLSITTYHDCLAGSAASSATTTCSTDTCPEVVAQGDINPTASLNSLGEVVWSQRDQATGVSQLYSSTRGQLTTDAANHFGAAINNVGDIIWVESVWDAQMWKTIYTIKGMIDRQPVVVTTKESWIGKVDINDHREIVWDQRDDAGTTTIYSNLRGQLTSGPNSYYQPSINNKGQIVFYGGPTGQIYLLNPGSVVPTTATDSSTTTYVQTPAILDDGDVLWTERSADGFQPYRLMSRNRGELVAALAMYVNALDVNACGDVIYLSYENYRTLYRLGNHTACVAHPDQNDSLMEASPVTLGSIFTGLMDSSTNPVDWYRFDATAGDSLHITVNFNQQPLNQMTIGLYDAAGNLVSAPTSTTSLSIHTEAGSSQSYFLKVESQSGRFGYSISLSKYTNNCSTDPCPEIVTQGSVSSASINALGEVVWSQIDEATGITHLYSSTRDKLAHDAATPLAVAINNLGDMVWIESVWDVWGRVTCSIKGIVDGQAVVVTRRENWISTVDINDRREIVWEQSDNAGTSTIYSSLRGQLISGPNSYLQPRINNQGDLVYLDGSSRSVFLLLAGSTAPLVIAEAPPNAWDTLLGSPVILDDGDVLWTEQTFDKIRPTRLMSRNRGELVAALAMYAGALDVNACGDIIYTAPFQDRQALYRLGKKAPCWPPAYTYPLTVAISGPGAGTVTSSPAAITLTKGTTTANIASGSQITLSAAPDVSSNFTGWSGACSGSSPCTLAINSAATVEATFAIRSFDLFLSQTTNGTIAGPGRVEYGGSATYIITPATGYHVASITLDGSDQGPATSFTLSNVTAPHTIGAAFTLNSYSFNTRAGNNGAIVGPSTVMHGDGAMFGIVPASGFHVADVIVDGVSVGAVTYFTFENVSQDHTITAVFAINSYSVTTSISTNGSVTGPASIDHGGSAIYAITPATGYHVADVVVDGTSLGAVSTYSFSHVTASHTIKATFAVNTNTIKATAGVNGSITGPSTVNYGNSATYTITPVPGYGVATIIIDGAGVEPATSYTFRNVTANHSISVSFRPLADLVAYNVGGPGSATRGKTINVATKIQNKGLGVAGSFTVAFYLSSDGSVTNSDVLLGTKTVAGLSVGSAITVGGTFPIRSSISSGKYYVGVIVDAGAAVPESDEANNTATDETSMNIK